MKIGFFDSGLGGLTILRAVACELTEYDYLYYGDTANLPYGDRNENEIYRLTKAGVRYLFNHDCAVVIIACNTASAETARRLQQEFLPIEYPDRKILGVIVPTIEELVFDTPTNVLLIGTKRTVGSGKYQIELDYKGNGNTILTQVATPELVPLIEAGEVAAAAKAAAATIRSQASRCSHVVLGCTHYTEIKDPLRSEFPDRAFLSQDEIIPAKLKAYLERHPEIIKKLGRGSDRSIHLTKHRPDYDRIMGQFLGGTYLPTDG